MENQLPAQQLLCTLSVQIAPGIFAKPVHKKKKIKLSNNHNSNKLTIIVRMLTIIVRMLTIIVIAAINITIAIITTMLCL